MIDKPDIGPLRITGRCSRRALALTRQPMQTRAIGQPDAPVGRLDELGPVAFVPNASWSEGLRLPIQGVHLLLASSPNSTALICVHRPHEGLRKPEVAANVSEAFGLIAP